jgi:hypothetical protein
MANKSRKRHLRAPPKAAAEQMPSENLYLFLIVGCGRWRCLSFAPGTTDGATQESWLLLLFGRRCRRCCRLHWRGSTLRRWSRLRLLRLLRAFRPKATAVSKLAIAAVRSLISFATAETTVLMIVTAVSVGAAIVAITVFARTVPVVPVAPEILAIASVEPLSVTAIMAIVVVALIPVMPLGTIVVAVLMIVVARLLLLEGLLRHIAGRLLCLDAEFVALVLPELVAITSVGATERMRARRAVVAERIDTALLRHLFAIAQDDAIIMFGVLQIIFRQYRIAGR